MTAQAQRSSHRHHAGRRARWAKYALLVVAVLAAITPVYWMITISLKTEVDQFAVPPRITSMRSSRVHSANT